jgi:hypothetical protein
MGKQSAWISVCKPCGKKLFRTTRLHLIILKSIFHISNSQTMPGNKELVFRTNFTVFTEKL